MAPPTATETATTSTTRIFAVPSEQPTPEVSSPSKNAEELVKQFVFHHENKKPFEIPGTEKYTAGPSPFYDKPLEGTSVFSSYEPVRSSGKLDRRYEYSEVTPLLGREFKDAKVSEIIQDEQLLQDLAVTIAERGVVFFRDQSDLTVDLQKKLTLALGRKAGNPKSSGLHIHPTVLAGGVLKEDGKIDPEIGLLNSGLRDRLYKAESGVKWARGSDTVFHSDITFEPIPAGFSMLRMVENPSAGGDTLWANGYALAEKVSPSFLSYLETLQGEFYQPLFKSATGHQDVPLYTAQRGAPENIGDVHIAVHPLVRTNPTTGWKSIFAIGSHFHRVLGVTEEESDLIKQYLNNLLYQSPELQLRFKWNSNDLAIWDNRSTYHSAIVDLKSVTGKVANRTGLRTLSTAERPFFDKNSKTQSEALLERLNLAENKQ